MKHDFAISGSIFSSASPKPISRKVVGSPISLIKSASASGFLTATLKSRINPRISPSDVSSAGLSSIGKLYDFATEIF